MRSQSYNKFNTKNVFYCEYVFVFFFLFLSKCIKINANFCILKIVVRQFDLKLTKNELKN